MKSKIVLWQSLSYGYSLWHFVRYERLADLVNTMQGKMVLDIGCGRGLLDFLFVDKTVFGTDLNLKEIREAKRIERTMKKVESATNHFVAADLNFLPFKKEFDIVIVSEVLEHLQDDRNALINLLPVLKNNGLLLVTIPNILRLGFSPSALMHTKRFMHLDHIREYKVNDVYRLVYSLPLKIEAITGIYLDFPLFRVLDPFAGRFKENFFFTKLRFLLSIILCRIYASLWMPLEKILWGRAYYVLVILKKSSTLPQSPHISRLAQEKSGG